MSLNLTGDPNKNIIPVFEAPGGGGKVVELIPQPNILVNDISDADTYRFELSTYDYLALIATLGLTAKAAGVTKSMPILKGTVIDRVELTFAYNKVIVSQTLTNSGGLSVPGLAQSDVGYNYVAQSISSNMSFTLTGNDGQGQPGSIDADVQSIAFGNLMWLGYGASKIGASAASMEAFIEALETSVVKTARAHTYFATGGANQKHFVAYPKAWGLATFTKGIFSGGYVRLMKVGSTMELTGSESDLVITNSAGYSEPYYVYESLYDNQADAVTPFIIS